MQNITIKRATVELIIPEHENYYGIRQAGRRFKFDRAQVLRALKHDGWTSLDEIEADQHMSVADWLLERCVIQRHRIIK